MAGNAISAWWVQMRPYAKAYKEVWLGLGIMTFLYYKVSYGGNKAVKDKPAH
ncbi:ATP synthase subunit ATP5MPL, mitochondrial [Centropristis striata]|uniref:ATP synthase subunit ATP5MPL, mitochondrial n=1 Tax=Centropristis striata TaxID=184440 RepID=UPI0027DFCD47|nr:ATP synthase subunit ATP5MPL, mitochondrial [Centropristis striata]